MGMGIEGTSRAGALWVRAPWRTWGRPLRAWGSEPVIDAVGRAAGTNDARRPYDEFDVGIDGALVEIDYVWTRNERLAIPERQFQSVLPCRELACESAGRSGRRASALAGGDVDDLDGSAANGRYPFRNADRAVDRCFSRRCARA